mgnify:CR=1 FL=1
MKYNNIPYTIDIFDNKTETLLGILATNCRRRRLEKGLSRKHLAAMSGVPAPTIAKFEQSAKISLESFVKLCIALGYYDEVYRVLAEPKFSTAQELETIQKNYYRSKGR